MRLFRASRPRTLFFFHETTWSGAPIQLLHLVTWLAEKGWEVAAAVPKASTQEAGPISSRLTNLGVATHPLLDLAQWPDLPALRDLCRQYEVVVANTLVMWAAVRAAHEVNRPSVWYIHESLVAQHLLQQIPEIQPTLPLAQVLVMPTQRTASLYRRFLERPIEVVPYGIPAAKKRPPLPHNRPLRFLLLGTYEPRKGQDLLLEAIAKLAAPLRTEAFFQMAGRRLDPKFFERLAAESAQLPNVELGAALEHEEAQSAIAAADVLVCASRDETMPVAILEAMSLAKAIVTTEVGGIAEWLRHEVDALLVRPEDSDALARALQRCIEDPILRRKLGNNAGRTFTRNFSISRLGKTFAALLRKARESTKQ